MTYNVRYFGHQTRGLVATNLGVTRIAKALAALKPLPDIICLQEVETQSLRGTSARRRAHPDETQLERLMAEFHDELAMLRRPQRFSASYFPAHSYRITERTSIYTTGLAIISRDGHVVRHHNAGSPHDITHRQRAKRLKQTRICAHMSFEHESGFVFDVFNTHLSLPSVWSREFWTSDARMGFGPNQLAEARTLADFVDHERRSPHFILLGDFNALPGSPVDRYLKEERGFLDAFSKVRGLTQAESRAFPTAGFLNLRMHLDHVYSSPEVAWLDFDGTHAFGTEGAFDGLSDHVPLIARLQVPPGVSRAG